MLESALSREDFEPKQSTPLEDLLRSLERVEYALSSGPKLNFDMTTANAFSALSSSDYRVSTCSSFSLNLVFRSEIVLT